MTWPNITSRIWPAMIIYRRTHFVLSALLQLGQAPVASLVAAIFPSRAPQNSGSLGRTVEGVPSDQLASTFLRYASRAFCLPQGHYPIELIGSPSSDSPLLFPSSGTQDEASLSLSSYTRTESEMGSNWHHSLSEAKCSARKVSKVEPQPES